MKAKLSNYRQSPRKVRLLADLARGKKVSQAVTELQFSNKRGARILNKLIKSAAANAGAASPASQDKLLIKKITVDKGRVLKRFRPGARGKAYPVHKHTSHIQVELEPIKETEKHDS